MTNVSNLNGQFEHGMCSVILYIYIKFYLKGKKKYEQMTQS